MLGRCVKLRATDRSSLIQLTLYPSTKSVNGEVLWNIERIVSLIVMQEMAGKLLTEQHFRFGRKLDMYFTQ